MTWSFLLLTAVVAGFARTDAAEPGAARPGGARPGGARPDHVLPLEVQDPWVRWLPAGVPAAGYMTLVNRGPASVVLATVTSPCFARIEMHRSGNRDGMTGMTPVDRVSLDPGKRVSFAPGGYHLMMMQPSCALHPGDKVPLTLKSPTGAVLTVDFTVRNAGGG